MKYKTREEIIYTEKGGGANRLIDKSALTSFLSPDGGLLKPKRYTIDFLSCSILHFGKLSFILNFGLLCFSIFLHIVGFFFFFPLFTSILECLNTFVAERTNFKLCVRPPLNHVMIYIFKFIVWRGNYLAVEVRFGYFVQ